MSARVLHLSTSLEGGAGIAATRLVEAQEAHGRRSSILSQAATAETDWGKWRVSTGAKILQKSCTLANLLLENAESQTFRPVSVGVITAKDIHSYQPDIVHVHNWYNLISIRELTRINALGFPIIMTLHDERFMTGGCHTTLGCVRYQTSCSPCPQSRVPQLSVMENSRQELRRFVEDIRPILVSPSKWLQNQVRQIIDERVISVTRIPNTVGHTLASHGPPGVFRESNSVRLGFVFGKAQDLLGRSLERLRKELTESEMRNVVLSGAGRGILTEFTSQAIELCGAIDSDTARADFWNSIDIGLYVSYADNFPNVILEGLACGVPFVTVDVGGCGEAVKETSGGVVCDPDPESLARALADLIRDRPRREQLSRNAYENSKVLYAPQSVAKAYEDLYEQMIQ